MKITYEADDILQIVKRNTAKRLSIPQDQLSATFSSLSYEKSITVVVSEETKPKEED
jgi:hypothetical protein